MDRFEQILEQEKVQIPDRKGFLYRVMKLQEERDAFVIGANEKSDFSEKTDKFPYQIRNQVKVRQRKRAEESL